MPLNSIKYFYNLNNINLNNDIFGYFDFSQTGYSGKSEFPSLFSNNSKLSLSNNNNLLWNNSGYVNLTGDAYAKYSGSLAGTYAATIGFSRDIEKDFIIFSSYGNNAGTHSGFNVGINAYGYPYVEYIDNIYGRIAVLNTNNRYQKTGLLFIEVDNNSCSIGGFTNDERFESVKCNFNQNGYISSNDIYIGGSPKFNNYNLSGKIFEAIIQKRDFLLYNQNLILSGFYYDINSSITTGYISGQTGVLYGDIISVSGCQYFISDTGNSIKSVDYYTGITEYFSNETEFRDFNNDIYYTFSTNFATGIINSGNISYANRPSICFSQIDYQDFFSYNSGYVINYSITNNYPQLKNQNYLLKYSNGVSLLRPFNTGYDILNMLIFENISNHNLLKFAQSDGNYISLYFDGLNNNINQINDQNFDLYFNGQLQRKSNNYTKDLYNGSVYYNPENDFLKSGSYLYNLYIYDIYYHNFIGTSAFNTEFFDLTGSYASGSTVNSINFNNSLIFLNGQLLTSGLDYQNSNILFNIGSGNLIAKQSLNQFDYKNIILNSGNNNVSYSYTNNRLSIVTGLFRKNNIILWLNGMRLLPSVDYIETDDSIFSNEFIETNAYIFYNKII